MATLFQRPEDLRALHVLASIPYEAIYRRADDEALDGNVLSFLVELIVRMQVESRLRNQGDIAAFTAAMARNPLIAAFCLSARALLAQQKGEVQAQLDQDIVRRNYVIRIGLFYTEDQIQAMSSAVEHSAPAPVEKAAAKEPTRRMTFRGLKSISTGVADPANRP